MRPLVAFTLDRSPGSCDSICMDSDTPTPMHPSFNPGIAWAVASASAELHRQEMRRIQEARRLAALLEPEDTRPTVRVPAPDTFRW